MYDKFECQDLCGLFYSVFNDNLGRINVAQYPPEFFSPESFNEIDNFVITKEDFANRVIVSEVSGKIVIGCLQSLENTKYPRNKFLFNVCFVVRDSCENIIAYENLARNVNRFFHSLEQETGMLHSAEQAVIRTCLENIYCNLIQSGVCKYTWEGFGTIYLKISATPSPSVTVDKEQVPIYLMDSKERLVPLDLTCQRLYPLLNRECNIFEMAEKCQVDLKVVIACVQNLSHVGVVKTVAQFQPTSSYICMPKLTRLTRDEALDKRLLAHVFGTDIINIDEVEIKLIVEIALRALATLTPVTQVQDCSDILLAHYPSLNCKSLIQFAEAEGLIKRIHSYPLAGANVSIMLEGVSNLTETMLDGSNSLEELSCLLDVSVTQLENELSKVDDMFIIRK